MNLESANTALESLKAQLKEAQERVILLTGAVQGAEIMLQSLEEQTKSTLDSVPKDTPSPSKSKKVNQSGKNSFNQ